ncbi:prepilin peptidase [Saccharothrix variisporea]|uniref:Leader peptidase (Prepilin peptidase)/N-methyltransferase n=1 Tax=Saccharothrix variisporea TaxID=543527 RepID=A0A495XD80_9PSEU|nr:A24 family peptidase [Saccharothrix variisporea]RKT70573.1 leader peptidase (prepilin peptidase)/N-methyltransferase [Saccharothrix variisporea]
MDVEWAVSGAIAGLPAGAVARGVVHRLAVPAGEPDRGCPVCGGRVGWTGRCCGRALGPRLEWFTAAVVALLAARFAGRPELAAFAFLGVLGVVLALVDVAVERLPDRLTLPAYPVVVALLGMTGDWAALGRAVLGGVALGGVYLVLAVLRPGGVGMGDVKLAGVLGLALGWLGWPELVLGGALAFVLLAGVGVVLLAARRITTRDALAFGPFMLVGALVAVTV